MKKEDLVAIVDDDAAVRDAVESMLRAVEIQVLPYASAVEFLEDPRSLGCGCVVLDVRLPGISGMDLQRRLNESGRDVAIIFVTGHGDVPLAVEAMRHGAVDFLEKPFKDQQLLDRVQRSLADWHIRQRQHQADEVLAARLACLTPREREVLHLLLKGRRSKEIAAALRVSLKTIEEHRSNVLHKMRVASTAELMRELSGQRRAEGETAKVGEESA